MATDLSAHQGHQSLEESTDAWSPWPRRPSVVLSSAIAGPSSRLVRSASAPAILIHQLGGSAETALLSPTAAAAAAANVAQWGLDDLAAVLHGHTTALVVAAALSPATDVACAAQLRGRDAAT